MHFLGGLKLIYNFEGLLSEKEYKTRNKKIGTKVDIYLGPSQGLVGGPRK